MEPKPNIGGGSSGQIAAASAADLAKKRYSRSVETKKLLKNVVKNERTNETISIPPIRGDPKDIAGTDTRPFFFGNPFVEKHNGVLRWRRPAAVASRTSPPTPNDCALLCMVDVPAFFTCRELVNFVRPMAAEIALMKIIRDDTPNKYMCAIKFKSARAAAAFHAQYNDIEFNSIEPDKCQLRFVDSIELEENGATDIVGLVADPSYGETPTCTVCLDRMEENNVLTILCNHSFHAECIIQWADTTCPICRYTQTPELVPDQKCFECGLTTDLWMCLICGNVGCGRYAEAHAYQHYEKTSHIFTLQVGGKLVWDYAGDNYVHRLIENSTDGKMVEYDGGMGAGVDGFEKEKEKISAVQLEYTCLLTSQLENQRMYFEERLREAEERFNEHGRSAQQRLNALELELKGARKDLNEAREELASTSTAKQQLDKKYQQQQQRAQHQQRELEEERQMCELLRKDKHLLTLQKEELERLRRQEIAGLEEQLHDLMVHFDSHAKIQQQVETGAVSKEELEGGSIEMGEGKQQKQKGPKRRSGNNKK